MKLSEAILLGSVSTPQAFKVLKDENGGTCAWGAAFEAHGLNISQRTVHIRIEECPADFAWAHQTWLQCPSCSSPLIRLRGDVLIAHLNDTHKWTRPQIAEWVKTIEASLSATQESTNEHSTTSASPAYPGERQVASSV